MPPYADPPAFRDHADARVLDAVPGRVADLLDRTGLDPKPFQRALRRLVRDRAVVRRRHYLGHFVYEAGE